MADIRDVSKLLIMFEQERGLDTMTQLRLHKMLYFAQGWHLAWHGNPLFNSEFTAYKYGPVAPEIRRLYGDCSNRAITLTQDEFDNYNFDNMTDEEVQTVIDVFNEYDKFSTWTLVDMSHETNPWMQHSQESSTIPIPEIQEHFSNMRPIETFETVLENFPESIA